MRIYVSCIVINQAKFTLIEECGCRGCIYKFLMIALHFSLSGTIDVIGMLTISCHCGEQNTRFPPMWHGFEIPGPGVICDYKYMWVEFVVSSRPCSEDFSQGSPVFLPP